MQRRKFLNMCGGAAVASMAPAAVGLARAQSAPLRMAVHPYNSALALVNTFRPLFLYLEKILQRPVEFYTAPSFDAFVNALLAGEYDIPVCPPHFAMLGVEKGHYVPLVHYRSLLEPILVVKAGSAFNRPADFAGRRIAMADKSALIRIVAIKWLGDAGLVAGKHYEIVERPTHGASITATAQGDVDAGVATTTAFRQVPADVQQKLTFVSTGLQLPHLFTMANRRLDDTMINRMRLALLDFSSHPEGRLFFEKSAYGGHDLVTASHQAALQPYLDPTRRIVDEMRPKAAAQ